jgi:16S rRNA (uracil1498-N3)-methyltransferase
MRRRFFVRAEDVGPETLRLTGDDAAHLVHALRLGPGAQIIAFDGAGHEYDALVSRIDADAVHCLIRHQRDTPALPGVRIVLGQGLPKARKLEWVIQKTVELGVAEIVPLLTARTVPQPVERTAASRHARWEKIAREACKQSGRSTVPRLWPVTPLEEFFAAFRTGDLKLILWEGERTRGLRGVLESDARVATAVVAVGPEGGFGRDEIECGEAYGFLPVSLGARILRTETAGLVMVSLLQYRFGDLG